MGIGNTISNFFKIHMSRMEHGESYSVLNSIYKGLTGAVAAWDKAAYAKGIITFKQLRDKAKQLSDNANNFFSTVKTVAKKTSELMNAEPESDSAKLMAHADSAIDSVKAKIAIGKDKVGSGLKAAEGYLKAHGHGEKIEKAKKSWFNVKAWFGEKKASLKDKIAATEQSIAEQAAAAKARDKGLPPLTEGTQTPGQPESHTEAHKEAEENDKRKAEKEHLKAEKKAHDEEEKLKIHERQQQEKEEEAARKAEDRGRFGKTMDKMKEGLGKYAKKAGQKVGLVKKDEPSGGGFLGALMTGLGWAVGKLGGIFGGIIETSTKFLAKHLGKAIWSLGGLFIKGFGKVLGLSSAVGWASRGVAALGSGAAMSAIGGVASAAATALAPIALPALAVAGVGLAIYGGYKYYKYRNRNEANDYDKWRFMHYGLGEDQQGNYNIVKQLESLVRDNLKKSVTDGKTTFECTSFSTETAQEIMKIFELSPREASDRPKADILGEWLKVRFIPAYIAHLNAIEMAKPGTELDKIEDLDPSQILAYLKAVIIDPSIYDYKKSPIKGYSTITVLKKDADDAYNALVVKASKKKSSRSLRRGDPGDVTKDPEVKLAEQKVAEKEAADEQAKKEKMAAYAANEEKYKGMGAFEKAEARRKEVLLALNKMAIEAGKGTTLAPTGAGGGRGASGYQPDKDGPGTVGGEGEPEPKAGTVSEKAERKPVTIVKNIPQADGVIGDPDPNLTGAVLGKNVNVKDLDPNVYNLFSAMAAEYHAARGEKIRVTSGYRSPEQQQYLFNSRKPGVRVARPGTSMHEIGLAIDIDPRDADALEEMGLLKKYGFTRPVSGEKWHMEPIGVSLNHDKVRNDPTARLMAINASPGRGGGGLGAGNAGSSDRGTIDVKAQRQVFEAKAASPAVKITEKTGEGEPMPSLTPTLGSKSGTPSLPSVPKTDTPSRMSVFPSRAATSTSTAAAPAVGPTPPPAPKAPEAPKVYPTSVVKPVVTQPVPRSPEVSSTSASGNLLASAQVANAMNQQLAVLNKIADLLNSIDAKFDPKALASLVQPSQPQAPVPPPPTKGSVSTSAVPLARVIR